MAYNAEAAFMAKDIFDAEKMVARKLSYSASIPRKRSCLDH